MAVGTQTAPWPEHRQQAARNNRVSVGDTSMASEEILDNFSKVLDTRVVQLNGMHAHVTLQGQEDLMLFTR